MVFGIHTVLYMMRKVSNGDEISNINPLGTHTKHNINPLGTHTKLLLIYVAVVAASSAACFFGRELRNPDDNRAKSKILLTRPIPRSSGPRLP